MSLAYAPQRRFTALPRLGSNRTTADMPRAPRNCGPGERVFHSSLMPANAITSAHFSVSAAISLPNSAGELGYGILPNAAQCDLTFASARPALITALSLSTMLAAGPLYAAMPPTVLPPQPRPA